MNKIPQSLFCNLTLNRAHFKTLLAALTLTLALIGFVGCQSSSPGNLPSPPDKPGDQTDGPAAAKSANEVSVMTFNVENMFDATHDEGTEDYTYLPKSKKSDPAIQAYCKTISNPGYREDCFSLDWSEAVVKFKLSQVAKVIRHVERGNGPDNILFSEVENLSVLKRLFDTELKDLGYQTFVLIEGFDTRGIDVGFASKFPIAKNMKPILHRIPFSDPKASKSRGILEVTVELPNKKLVTFMSAHFPSQANPTGWRADAFEFVAGLMKKYEAEGRAVIFGGDLNTLKEEDEESGYYSKVMSEVAHVTHLIGCKFCKGSHYYRGEWSFLDVMNFGKGLSFANAELDLNSIDIVRAPVHLKSDGTPKRFNSEKMEGVGDHLPIYARIKILGKTAN